MGGVTACSDVLDTRQPLLEGGAVRGVGGGVRVRVRGGVRGGHNTVKV